MSATKKQKTEPVSHAALAGETKDKVKITRALISVFDKAGVLELAKALDKHGVEILSTGGTAKKIRDAGIKVVDAGEHTKFPEILNGRVKTLHPLIHGGLLYVRGNETHENECSEHGIKAIDMVVCNLYPFEHTVAKGSDFSTCIENIDIGGPSMIRSAAKNNAAVAIVTDPAQYTELIKQMDESEGALDMKLRRKLACAAFTLTAGYDTAISTWFQKQV